MVKANGHPVMSSWKIKLSEAVMVVIHNSHSIVARGGRGSREGAPKEPMQDRMGEKGE